MESFSKERNSNHRQRDILMNEDLKLGDPNEYQNNLQGSLPLLAKSNYATIQNKEDNQARVIRSQKQFKKSSEVNDYTTITKATTKTLLDSYYNKQKFNPNHVQVISQNNSQSFDNFSKKASSNSSKLFNKNKIQQMLNKRRQIEKDRSDKVDNSLKDSLNAEFAQEIKSDESIQKTVSYQKMDIEFDPPNHDLICQAQEVYSHNHQVFNDLYYQQKKQNLIRNQSIPEDQTL